MKLKLDENGHVAVIEGKPVYTQDDGTETAFDAPGVLASVSKLNGEAMGNRERLQEARKLLKTFEGIDDADAARAAMETVKNLDAKKLVDVGEVERVRADVMKSMDAKYAPDLQERDDLKAALYSEKIGGSFARSKYITDSLAIPADMAQSAFGGQFKIEDGQVVAYRSNGEVIRDAGNPIKAASFDDALKVIVGEYAHRDTILKGSGQSGSGAQGGAGNGGSKTINRTQFLALSPAAQASMAKEAGAGTATITD